MTVIICPACKTRFETAAVIPPTGRKVRCSKCGNVWQAIAEIEPAKPAVVSPAPPPVQPSPAPAAPMPPRRAPETRPAPPPRQAPPEPRPVGPTGLGNTMGRFSSEQGLVPKPSNGFRPNDRPPQPPKPAGPLFSTDEEMQPDLGGDGAITGANSRAGAGAEDLGSYNAGALVNPDAG